MRDIRARLDSVIPVKTEHPEAKEGRQITNLGIIKVIIAPCATVNSQLNLTRAITRTPSPAPPMIYLISSPVFQSFLSAGGQKKMSAKEFAT